MKEHRKRILSLVLSVLLVLPLLACRQNPEPGTSSTPAASTPSSANPGASTPPKLDTRPDSPVVRDLGSAERTSECQVAETENGFYLQFHGILYYADKSDLTNWVPVCNKPDCNHDRDSCTAYMSGEAFWLRENRIYTQRSMRQIDGNSPAIFGICSSAADGTDFRNDFLMSDVFPSNFGGTFTSLATPDALFQCYNTMDADGNFRYALDCLDYNGRHNMLETTGVAEDAENSSAVSLFSSHLINNMYGDIAAYCSLLSNGNSSQEIFKHLYRFTESGFQELKGIHQYDLKGAKLDGDGLYYFVPGDGYYYVQLSTGASIRWMDAQLPDSRAYQFGTDSIFEMNFYYGRTSSDAPQLRWFDGTQWRTIAVPEALPLTEAHSFDPVALGRERLFLMVYGTETDEKTAVETYFGQLYSVDLTADELVLVPCHTFTDGIG